MIGGRIAFDGTTTEFLQWAVEAAPALATPGAHLLQRLGLPAVPGVKAARAALRERGLLPEVREGEHDDERRRRRTREQSLAAVSFERVWHELANGPTILRDVSLRIEPGERVALMGRNGAGKSTLLRHAAGLMEPTRGRVRTAGRVALLLQNPTDYLIHERVGDEASAPALSAVGLGGPGWVDRHPRDLSGGEKQRLALAIVLDEDGEGRDRALVACLDEPTRGMDRGAKEALAVLLRSLQIAVLVATHDPEFVAAFAERVVLLADGAPIADGPAAEVLSGGTYFATETARILGGAGTAMRPEDGANLIIQAEVRV
jgi:energy-coupling factor transport system ATP-binding protein